MLSFHGPSVCHWSEVSVAGLWEMRSSLPRGRIARVLFCVAGEQMVLLNGFYQKDAEDTKTGK